MSAPDSLINDLCRETDAGNLQQFEALLALTNLLSCGEGEQNKFDAEK